MELMEPEELMELMEPRELMELMSLSTIWPSRDMSFMEHMELMELMEPRELMELCVSPSFRSQNSRLGSRRLRVYLLRHRP